MKGLKRLLDAVEVVVDGAVSADETAFNPSHFLIDADDFQELAEAFREASECDRCGGLGYTENSVGEERTCSCQHPIKTRRKAAGLEPTS